MDVKNLILAVALTVTLPMKTHGQQMGRDSLSVSDSVLSVNNRILSVSDGTPENYRFEWRQTILPASLIGVGAVALAPGFIRNGSRSVTNSVIDIRGKNNRLEWDDYIQYLPVASSLMLGCTGVKAKHSFRDRAFIVATSYATLAVLTNVPKFCIDEKRPEFAGHNSFPSGHTATVFMGAELVRIEYGSWYGIGAYTIATGVGFMRMYNGRHWLHDVVAGAGVGILSARVGEWSCQLWQKIFQKKGRKENNLVFTPVASPVNGGYYGFTMGCCF
ncbi:phosphatase PAP2 family protein [Bacteroides acidifaciens]|nr:phosphatase PAP2 family protein [Bacteroides acidifaciens]